MLCDELVSCSMCSPARVFPEYELNHIQGINKCFWFYSSINLFSREYSNSCLAADTESCCTKNQIPTIRLARHSSNKHLGILTLLSQFVTAVLTHVFLFLHFSGSGTNFPENSLFSATINGASFLCKCLSYYDTFNSIK